jgi:DNA-binding GntR family transcriptional regulator
MLADEILTGELKAGSRLYIRDLIARTGLGATPLREGATQLVARGLVEIEEQRGFYVADVSDDDTTDLFWLINLIEHAALRRAMEKGGQEWIERIEHALETFLQFCPASKERPSVVTRRFCDLHKALHLAFVSGCGSPRALDVLDVLYDQEIRICHTRTPKTHRLQFLLATCDAARHRELAHSVMRRDVKAATATLAADRRAVSVALGLGPAGQEGTREFALEPTLER